MMKLKYLMLLQKIFKGETGLIVLIIIIEMSQRVKKIKLMGNLHHNILK
jgi:hypothetical protein